MPYRREQVDSALAILQHGLRGINVAYAIAVLCEDDDRGVRTALRIFGIDVACERPAVVRKHSQPIPSTPVAPTPRPIERRSRSDREARALRYVRCDSIETVDPQRAHRTEVVFLGPIHQVVE